MAAALNVNFNVVLHKLSLCNIHIVSFRKNYGLNNERIIGEELE